MASTNIERWHRFELLGGHALRGKEIESLTKGELEFAEQFICDNSHLGTNEYVLKLNRLPEITDERVRAKNRTKVWSLLLEAATAEVPPKPRRK